MEKLVINPYDKECMRLAILKHEETFKEQVYELHRLYQIQKLLMKNIASSRHNPLQQSTKWYFKNNSNSKSQNVINDHHHEDLPKKTGQCLDLDRPAAEETIEMVDESELELTLGPSNSVIRSKFLVAAAPRPSSDSGPTSFSSSSTGSSHVIKSRTTSSSNTKVNNASSREERSSSIQEWRVDHSIPISSSSNPSRNFLKGSNAEEHLRQDSRQNNNHPSWLFQVLSLNMTS